jgi:hypothetical protein
MKINTLIVDTHNITVPHQQNARKKGHQVLLIYNKKGQFKISIYESNTVSIYGPIE